MRPEEMWERYRRQSDPGDADYEAWAFGDAPDALAERVARGIKTATSSLHALYAIEGEPLPKAGEYSVILDSRGEARCVIRNTRVYVVPFHRVSAEHAFKEGEGDRSLAYWTEVHRRFFSGCLKEIGRTFEETMDVVCEEFEVVYAE